MAARLWSATFPGEVPGTAVAFSLAEDPGNAHESACSIEVAGTVEEAGSGITMHTVGRVLLSVADMRAIVATVGGWPGVSRG